MVIEYGRQSFGWTTDGMLWLFKQLSFEIFLGVLMRVKTKASLILEAIQTGSNLKILKDTQ